LKIAGLGVHLHWLKIVGASCGEINLITILMNCPNLKSLNISESDPILSDITDKVIQIMTERCPSIEYLDLSLRLGLELGLELGSCYASQNIS
jgi:tRNA threonylcarbamoyladenosine modification (KEOPS) complex Cgi121 subunit